MHSAAMVLDKIKDAWSSRLFLGQDFAVVLRKFQSVRSLFFVVAFTKYHERPDVSQT